MSLPSALENESLAKNRLSTGSVVFLTLAMVAPIGGVTGAMVLGIALGNGPGMPGVYLLAGLILLCFAGGYAAMSRHVTNAGAFYAYVTRGLGRHAGAVAAGLAVITYNAAMCAVSGLLGFFMHVLALDQFKLDLPWYVWVAFALAIIAVLGRRRIDVSARVLGAALVLELLILLVLVVAIVIQRGLGAFSLDAVSPTTVFSGGVGVAIVFAFYSFGGFEATAIYSEESKNPRRTVSRATYLSIAVIAVFYTIFSWSLVAVYGSAHLQSTVRADPGNIIFTTNTHFVGSVSTNIMQYLVVTSFFVSLLGIHNAASRYFYSLGRDRLLPEVLARTSASNGAPHIASAVQIGITVLVVAGFAIVGADPLLTLSSSLGGLSTVSTMLLWAASSLACAVFFLRRREVRISTVVAPLIATVGLAVLCVLALISYPLLTGVSNPVINQLPWLLPIVAIAAVAFTSYLRRRRPEIYARIGGTADPSETTGDAHHGS